MESHFQNHRTAIQRVLDPEGFSADVNPQILRCGRYTSTARGLRYLASFKISVVVPSGRRESCMISGAPTFGLRLPRIWELFVDSTGQHYLPVRRRLTAHPTLDQVHIKPSPKHPIVGRHEKPVLEIGGRSEGLSPYFTAVCPRRVNSLPHPRSGRRFQMQAAPVPHRALGEILRMFGFRRQEIRPSWRVVVAMIKSPRRDRLASFR